MKVRTFDLLTGDPIECELVGLTVSGLMTLTTPDGKTIVRHVDRCQYAQKDLEDWYKE